MRNRQTILWGILFLLTSLFASACAEEDTTPPPPPYLDPVDSPTGKDEVVITGSAEFGAKITITGATVTPAELFADPFTARFRVVAALAKDATNTLTFTATDDAGNISVPTTLTLVHETGHGVVATVKLDLFVNQSPTPAVDPVKIKAGDTLAAKSSAQDAQGHPIETPLSLSTDIPGAFVAGSMIANIRTAGVFRVAAVVPGTAFTALRSVTVEPGPAEEITLEAVPQDAVAGQMIRIKAEGRDAFGNLVPNTAITLSSTPALAASYTPPCSNTALSQGFGSGSNSFVAYNLSAVSGSDYQFTLTATAGTVVGETQVVIRPAPAARFAPIDPDNCSAGEQFVFTDSTWQNDITGALAIAAGQTVYYRYAVIDAYGNPTSGPVSVFVSAPNAMVIDDGVTGRGQIANVTAASSYQVSAYILGVAAPAVRTFSVDVGPAKIVDVFLSTTLSSPENTITAFATVRDQFGNRFPCPQVQPVDPLVFEFVSDPAGGGGAVGTLTCNNALFQQDFRFSVSDTYTIRGTWDKDGENVVGSAYVTILGIDSTPPTVQIENVLVNGVPCLPSISPPMCEVAPGDEISFQVVANDNISLSEVEYLVFFETIQRAYTRRVLLSSDSQLPVRIDFAFGLNNNVMPEDAPLVARAMDGAGNIATSNQVVIRAVVFATGGRDVQVIALNEPVNGPVDVAFDNAGNLFIANDGNQDLLKLGAGMNMPVVFSNWGWNSAFLETDGNDNLYVTRGNNSLYRVSPDGGTITTYLTTAGAGLVNGLSRDGQQAAKGLVNVLNRVDAVTVTVGSQQFEFDSDNNCTPTGAKSCVNVNGQNTNDEWETALAASITQNSSSVQAVITSNQVVLAALSAGQAGNTIALVSSNNGNVSVSGATLREGHDEDIFIGVSNSNNIYRMPLGLTPTVNESQNDGTFNVGRAQFALAVRDLTTVSSANLRDLVLYFVADQATDELRAYRAVDSAAPALVFANIGNAFNDITDVVVEPATGCLLVADRTNGNQNGAIYAVDTRDPANQNPTITEVARGFRNPQGLTFHDGKLYVTDSNRNVIIEISPTLATDDCL